MHWRTRITYVHQRVRGPSLFNETKAWLAIDLCSNEIQILRKQWAIAMEVTGVLSSDFHGTPTAFDKGGNGSGALLYWFVCQFVRVTDDIEEKNVVSRCVYMCIWCTIPSNWYESWLPNHSPSSVTINILVARSPRGWLMSRKNMACIEKCPDRMFNKQVNVWCSWCIQSFVALSKARKLKEVIGAPRVAGMGLLHDLPSS